MPSISPIAVSTPKTIPRIAGIARLDPEVSMLSSLVPEPDVPVAATEEETLLRAPAGIPDDDETEPETELVVIPVATEVATPWSTDANKTSSIMS